MAAFEHDPELYSRDLAFRLVARSFVTLFWRREILDHNVDWLRTHGYQIVQLDATRWLTPKDLHNAMVRALSFPEYYGHNLDAFNDCLRDVLAFDYGPFTPDATGIVFVFTSYDTLAAACPREAHIVLDILADHARYGALFGDRIMCLVQSDDPRIEFRPVGATAVWWNDAEWSIASRTPG